MPTTDPDILNKITSDTRTEIITAGRMIGKPFTCSLTNGDILHLIPVDWMLQAWEPDTYKVRLHVWYVGGPRDEWGSGFLLLSEREFTPVDWADLEGVSPRRND